MLAPGEGQQDPAPTLALGREELELGTVTARGKDRDRTRTSTGEESRCPQDLQQGQSWESERATAPPSITTPRERRSLLTAGRDTLMEHRQDRLGGNGKANPQSTGPAGLQHHRHNDQTHPKGQKGLGSAPSTKNSALQGH